jgi:peptide/nickel transport system permease protein
MSQSLVASRQTYLLRLFTRDGRLSFLRSVPWLVLPYVIILVVVALVALLAPLLVPHDPNAQTLASRLTPPDFLPGGDSRYWLGADNLGRDVLSRMIMGARVSLAVGLGAVVIGGLLGSTIGLIAGYWGGWIDEVLMTLGDIKLAFPNILLAIAVIAVLGPSLVNLTVVLGITGWVTYARIARGVVLKLKNEDFVAAVRVLGGTETRILLRHILPNCASHLLVVATLDLARIIIAEATLSFLGLGVQPPTPSWGGMISAGRGYLDTAWWISMFPGFALFLTALSVSRCGDWLRDALDPTLRTK